MSAEPKVLGSYRIVGVVGQGGMGRVYRGVHVETGRLAALKTILVPRLHLLQSLRREIHALSRLRHPGVVRVLESGINDGLPWYAMELLEGRTLRQYILQGRPVPVRAKSMPTAPMPKDEMDTGLPQADTGYLEIPLAKPLPVPESGEIRRPRLEPVALQRTLKVIRRLCTPLAYLHGEGVVHRDLKPGNVVVSESGRPVIVDFGLLFYSTGGTGRERLDLGGGVLGTAPYMSPEQARGDLVDARSDLYALGCILFELLTGRVPFEAKAPTQILWKHLTETPPRLSEFLDGVPPELEDLMSQLLAKRPQDRLGYAEDVAHALEALGAERDAEPSVAPRPYLYRPELAGREELLDRLTRSMDQAREGKGRLIFVSAESGIGKTRLLVHLTKEATAQDMMVLLGEPAWTNSSPSGQGISVGPLQILRRPLQAIADWCQDRGPLEASLVVGPRCNVLGVYVTELLELPGQADYAELPILPPEAARIRLYQALLETFVALSQRQPLLLALDDLQWADELTIGFLRFLAEGNRLENAKILVVAAFRSEESGPELRQIVGQYQGDVVHLKRLEATAVGRMIEDMLALPTAPEGLIQLVTRSSEGNPFFVAEYLRMAVEEGLLRKGVSGRWLVEVEGSSISLPTPGSIRDLATRRLFGLTYDARRLVEAAAVLGREMREARLTPVAGLEEDAEMDALEELRSRQILEEMRPDGFRFTHDQLRDAVLDAMAPERRQALHRKAAEVMEAETRRPWTHIAALGHHWEEAGESLRAAERYWAAARKSAERFALSDAERLFNQALRLFSPSSSEAVRVRNELAREVLWALGRPAEAAVQHRKALEEARVSKDEAGQSMSLRGLSTILRVQGQIPQSLAAGTEALELARRLEDRALEASAMTVLGAVNLSMGRLGEAQRFFEDALALYRKLADRRMEAILLSNLGVVEREVGRPERAFDLQRQALQIHWELRNRRSEGITLEKLGILERDLYRLSDAEGKFEQAVRILHEVGDGPSEAMARIGWAELCLDLGRLSEAKSLLMIALEAFGRAGDQAGRATAFITLSRLLRAEGASTDQPTHLLAEAEAIFRHLDSRLDLAYCLCEQAALGLAIGKPVRDLLAEVRQLAREAQVGPQGPLGKRWDELRKASEAASPPSA